MQIPAEWKIHSIGFFYKALPFSHLFFISYLSALNILSVPSDYPCFWVTIYREGFIATFTRLDGTSLGGPFSSAWSLRTAVLTTFLKGLSSKCLVKVQYKERELRISFVILVRKTMKFLKLTISSLSKHQKVT